MLELLQIKICSEFAIDTREKVHVESGGDARWIVIGEKLNFCTFFKVGAKEQGIARFEDGSNLAKELVGGRAIKVADSAAEKQDADMLTGFTPVNDGTQPFQIWLFETDDVDQFDLSEFLFAGSERGGRDLDRIV